MSSLISAGPSCLAASGELLMNRTVLAVVAVIALSGCTAPLRSNSTVLAQDRTKDEAAINEQVDAIIYSWNNHNYDDLKTYATEDTDWVNVVGMWWKGRKASQIAHQIYHNTFLNGSVCEKESVAIRFITQDVAIAHVVWHFYGGAPLPDGTPPKTKDDPNVDLATLVFVKQMPKN
jgi:uncharacterized protein (TIGR02246 family)